MIKAFFIQTPPEKLSIYCVTFSVFILLIVHIMQHFFELAPCELCIWQRYPYFVALSGAVLVPLHKEILALTLQTFSFFIGSLIALYHTLIERGFLAGHAGCSSTFKGNLSIDALTVVIENTPIVKCNEILFSFLGLSLSNYNLIISVAITLIFAYSLWFYKKLKI